ncbi:SDR family NAD(P)-dependent oxidoreductase [Rhizobium sp. 2YAF20]|uniref:SDR family NAD(P)-dependent oxidoreductase n=1 Tax=Rhizobium sp. 2YAF20 TaxID=3233027 RepID=UPI003F9463F6
MKPLLDRTVLVTGSGQGIGKALAIALANAGANLVMVDIAHGALQTTAQELEREGRSILAMPGDICDELSMQQVLEKATEAFGGIDILVNNAAIGPERAGAKYLTEPKKFWEIEDNLWLAMLRTNVFGAQLLSRLCVPGMLTRRWGRIVNITTSLDTMFRPGTGGYGPCKAALEALSRIMSHDLEGSGVTANVLLPGGPVNTDMIPTDSGLSREDLIQPEQMCDPLIWLCSSDADDVNGIRVIARRWRNDLPSAQRLSLASAPVAWPQLGAQSMFPQMNPAT